MLPVDVFTAYAICGAGGLVGAVMLQLVQTPEAQVRRAIRWCTVAFLTLAVSLGSVVVVTPATGSWPQALMAAGTLVTILVFRQGIAILTGVREDGRLAQGIALALALIAGCAGLVLDPRPYQLVFALGFAAVSTLLTSTCVELLRTARDAAERAVGLAAVGLVASAWVRVVAAAVDSGPPPAHLIAGPGWLVGPMALFYGVLPSVVATLLLSVVNARLRNDLNERATVDELTGVLTRRALREVAPALIERDRAAGRGSALLMLDFDHFKAINDRFGHASGDLVLQRAGTLLREHLRSDAQIARYGGEEFVAVLSVPDAATAHAIAERLCAAVRHRSWRAADGRSMAVTISIGVAFLSDGESFDAALARADQALYRAKHGGRDQVQVAVDDGRPVTNP